MATTREKAVLEVRMIHAAFVTTVFLLVFCVRLSAPAERPVSQEIVLAIAAVTVAEIAIGFAMRTRFMNRATEALANGESKMLQAWRVANILSFAHAETVALFGVALKFLGASWRIAGPFFFVGFALLLWWTPRLQLPSSASVSAPPPPPAA